MGQALYRKYRSKSFADVVGQDHITKTLNNALKTGKISHAYLFTGPRGVGKTSVARILAHEVNSLPYNDKAINLDIIEIDAASNRRIDEIRDLRDRVRIAPAQAKYKVYIIDEVHMLTREAFNALLKTLEEPPAHCIFILATTESHKLPETIVSRTQRFEFKPITAPQASTHLESIAKTEKIKIDKPALDLLAEFGNGSFRDSISYLDQLSSLNKTISEDDVRELLGLPTKQEIASLLGYLEVSDSSKTLDKLRALEQKGVNAASVAAALSEQVRALAANGQIDRWQIRLLQQLLNVSASNRPKDALEIALLGACADNNTNLTSQPPIKNSDKIVKKPEPKAVKQAETKTEVNQLPAVAAEFELSKWEEVVERSKKQAASIYTALRLAEPRYSNGVLVLVFQFPLHQKKLTLAKNKDIVKTIVKQVSGQEILIEAIVEKKPKIAKFDLSTHETANMGAISNIFGSAEVLEA